MYQYQNKHSSLLREPKPTTTGIPTAHIESVHLDTGSTATAAGASHNAPGFTVPLDSTLITLPAAANAFQSDACQARSSTPSRANVNACSSFPVRVPSSSILVPASANVL